MFNGIVCCLYPLEVDRELMGAPLVFNGGFGHYAMCFLARSVFEPVAAAHELLRKISAGEPGDQGHAYTFERMANGHEPPVHVHHTTVPVALSLTQKLTSSPLPPPFGCSCAEFSSAFSLLKIVLGLPIPPSTQVSPPERAADECFLADRSCCRLASDATVTTSVSDEL